MRSHLFRDYGFSLIGLTLAAAAMAIVGTSPAKPAPSGGFTWAHSGAGNYDAIPYRYAAMQPGNDAGSFVGDRAQSVGKPGDLKAGVGVKSGGDASKSRAVDARKQTVVEPAAPWSVSLKPT